MRVGPLETCLINNKLHHDSLANAWCSLLSSALTSALARYGHRRRTLLRLRENQPVPALYAGTFDVYRAVRSYQQQRGAEYRLWKVSR